MGYRRKSWTEKLADDKGLPIVSRIDGKMSKRWGEGTVVIPAPREVDALMRATLGGSEVAGPALVEERDTVTFVPPKWNVAIVVMRPLEWALGGLEARTSGSRVPETAFGTVLVYLGLFQSGGQDVRRPTTNPERPGAVVPSPMDGPLPVW